jgi:hypothetical protein
MQGKGLGVKLIAWGRTLVSCMQYRHVAAVTLLVTLMGAGCQTSQPEKALVLSRPPAGAYRDPDPTYGVPLPLKVIQAGDFGYPDEAQKTPQWLRNQVTVGSLAVDDDELGSPYQGWRFYRQWADHFDVFPWQLSSLDLIEMVNGTKGPGLHPLFAPIGGRRVFLLITGPWVQSGQSWFPVEVWRDGSTITVIVEQWYDQLARFANVPHRCAALLSIGKLPRGDYTLRVERRLLRLDQAAENGCYHWSSTETRSMAFRVLPAPHSAASTVPGTGPAASAVRPAPLLAPAPFIDIDFDENGRGGRPVQGPAASVHRQWPFVRPFRLKIDEDARAISHWLRAGTFDSKCWDVKPDEPVPSKQRPRLSPPDRWDGLYASVICPVPLQGGEWVALRKIIRSGRDVMLHLDLIRAEAAGPKPEYYAGVVVSLGYSNTHGADVPPVDVRYEAGVYRVRVVWRVIQDGGNTAPTGVDRTAADLLDRATGPVELTIP